MDQIVESLYLFYDHLCTLQNPVIQTPAVKKIYDEFVELLSTPMTEADVQSIAEQITFRKDLTRLHGELHLRSEKKVAEDYLEGRIDDLFQDTWFDKHLPVLLKSQVEHWERLGFDFSQRDKKLAMIGGGALPQSQIHFTIYSGAPVTCIDRDDEVVSLVRQVLNKMKQGDLPVIQAEGNQADYSEFDLVTVAAMVEDKASVLKQIRATSDAWVCVRNPLLLHQLVREPIHQQDAETLGFRLAGTCRIANSISTVFQPV
ncbi:nicotianamine synthase family protein [Oceanospirillum sediminis]|uniref:Nicotianamine synthase n=1 Tax=Oceanospirillum sediminis TaxID=2760088 RepID=A0A839IND7_9GAMM|nr:nicotianamine synthase family protein [Oceanospirillum sediminis]MBB1485796.1 hypothetical protein [Oceanospirillum sediminis]